MGRDINNRDLRQNNSQPTSSIQTRVVRPELIQARQEKANTDAQEKEYLLSQYPELKNGNYSLEYLREYHKRMSKNNATISQDTRTEQQHKIGEESARQIRDTQKAVEIAENRPEIALFPGALPLIYWGAHQNLKRNAGVDMYGPQAMLATGAEVAFPFVAKGAGKAIQWGQRSFGSKANRVAAVMNQNIMYPIETEFLPYNVGWGPKQIIPVTRAQSTLEMPSGYYPKRWDVIQEGANPNGAWFQGQYGIPRTVENGATQVKSDKAANARNLFATRPVQLKGELEMNKPLVTIGDVPSRSNLSWQAEQLGSDGIIYNGVYDNGFDNNQVILAFNPEKSFNQNARRYGQGTLSFAERLGIPKGERNNLNKFQKDALFDLEQYINSGQNRQTLYINPETGLISYEPKQEYIQLTPELVNGKTQFAITPEGRGTYDINFRKGIPNVGISEHKNLQWIPEFNQTLGEVEMFGGNFAPYNFRLTAPKTDAMHIVAENPEEQLLKDKLIAEASPRIDKNIMKDFWKGVSEATRPGSYISADAGRSPLGFDMIRILKNGKGSAKDNNGIRIPNTTTYWEDILSPLRRPTKWFAREDGLSTDSYLALLKQASREGSPYELRYSPDGFTVFNNQSIDNKFISDLLIKAQNKEIPQNEFLKAFHDWVAPYGGMDAKIVNGKIVIPHPFLYKRKQGGKLIPKAGIHIKDKNKGKFTKSAKQAGQSVQEHAKSVLNNPNATPLQKKRANFARNAAKWHKK